MQVQPTSNVSFGMKSKFYGNNTAIKEGLTRLDLVNVEDYISSLEPQSKLLTTVFTDALERGKGSIGIDMFCDGAHIDSDTLFQSLDSKPILLVDLMKKMADEIVIQLNTKDVTKKLISRGAIADSGYVFTPGAAFKKD